MLELNDCELFGGSWFGPGTTCDDLSICNESPCPADVDGNGAVAVDDLLLVLGNYGQTGPNEADINDDGIVNVDDLLMVIGAWGPC